MKKFLPLFLVSSLFLSAVTAQTTSFPPRLNETWRVDIDGLAPATLKFTMPSNANPGAIDGEAEMSGFAGKSRAVSNQGRYLMLWTAKEGTYYCVFESNPQIQGNTVKGLGALLERPNTPAADLNKGCSATNISAASSSAVTTSPVATDAPMPVPIVNAPPQKLERGQNWRLAVSQNNSVLNTDAYNIKVLNAASSLPTGLNGTGWFEASVDLIQAFSVFSRTPDPIRGLIRFEAGVISVVLLKSTSSLSCEANTRQLRENARFVAGVLQFSSGSDGFAGANSTCNLQHAGTNGNLPADSAATLENAKRASGKAAAWAGLKTVAYRTEINQGVARQTVSVLDFEAGRLYREFLQGTGSQQVITAKEWQTSQGTYRLEAGSPSGVQRISLDTPNLNKALYTDFWALRFGATGWDNASLEPIGNNMQLLTVGRKGLYTRFIITAGKYNGIQTPFSLYTLTVTPEQLADAGGILAPLGTWKVTSSAGQFDQSLIEKIIRVVVNFPIPNGLFDIK
jgi:hypothetical protein